MKKLHTTDLKGKMKYEKMVRIVCLFLVGLTFLGTISVGAYAVPGASSDSNDATILSLIAPNSGVGVYASTGATADGYMVFRYFLEDGPHEEKIDCNIRNTKTPCNHNVVVYQMLEELSNLAVSHFNSVNDSISSNDSRLHTATCRFNCHSYAWYSQDTSSNQYWMNDPSLYYTDGSYDEVTTPAIGDIICYFDDNGTPNNTADDSNLHSGIVVSILSGFSQNLAGIYIVESKWGAAGVYRHNGYECPYTAYDAANPASNSADYVKFYRRSGHTHSFTTYNDNGNMEYHECICSCGMIIHAPHTWVEYRSYALGQGNLYYIPQYRCSKCDAFTLNPV